MTQFFDHNPGVAITSNRTHWLVIFRNDSSVAITEKPRSLFGERLWAFKGKVIRSNPTGQDFSLYGGNTGNEVIPIGSC